MQFKERVPLLNTRMVGNQLDLIVLQVVGANLTTSNSTAALAVGSNLAVIKDNGSGTVTITFNEPLTTAPTLLASQVNISGGLISTWSSTTTQLVYTTTTASTGSALAHANATLILTASSSKV